MKNSYRTLALCMITAAISLTHASCKKEEPIAPPPSPEQKAVMEVLKKSAEVAKTVFAAKVNGVEVTMHDLVREMNRIAPKYVKDGEKTPPATTAKIRKEALDNLIFNELAVQEAVRQGITVSPEKVNEVVKLMKEQLGSNDAYQKYLDDLGITEEGLKKRIERSHLLEIVTAKEVYQKITIEDKDARLEYEKNKTLYKNGDKQLTYDEAAPVVKKRLTAVIGADRKQEWGKVLRKKAKIEIAKESQR